jgi:hypothetical protein
MDARVKPGRDAWGLKARTRSRSMFHVNHLPHGMSETQVNFCFTPLGAVQCKRRGRVGAGWRGLAATGKRKRLGAEGGT